MTPFTEAKEHCNRSGIGFWGTVGRYELLMEKMGIVTYDSLAECPPERFFREQRIIIRRIISRQHRIHATYVNAEFAINKSYIIVISKEPSVSMFYFLALLNSALFSQMFIWSSEVAKRDDFPQLDIATVRELPIRRINFTTPLDERERLREKGKTLYELCLNKGSADCVLGFVKHHLSADPERSDVVHDLLGFLAEQMIEMNKAKGEEIRGFLRWLEREIGVPIESLKNKTAVQGYYKKGLDDLIDVLKGNRRLLRVEPSERAFQERVEHEFQASLDKLKPLMGRISKTDKLIDQIVYQLYGLTEEEIAIVEVKMR